MEQTVYTVGNGRTLHTRQSCRFVANATEVGERTLRGEMGDGTMTAGMKWCAICGDDAPDAPEAPAAALDAATARVPEGVTLTATVEADGTRKASAVAPDGRVLAVAAMLPDGTAAWMPVHGTAQRSYRARPARHIAYPSDGLPYAPAAGAHECDETCPQGDGSPDLFVSLGARQEPTKGTWEHYAAEAARLDYLDALMAQVVEGSAFAGGSVNLPWRGDGTKGAGVGPSSPAVRYAVDAETGDRTVIVKARAAGHTRGPVATSGTAGAERIRRHRAAHATLPSVTAPETAHERMTRLSAAMAAITRRDSLIDA